MKTLWLLACLLVTACAPLPQLPYGEAADLEPPMIVSIDLEGPESLVIGFSEPVELLDDRIMHSPLVTVAGARAEQDVLRFAFAEAPAAGVEHFVEAQVADAAGNTLRFVARFHGLNLRLPAMLINEFTPRGGGNNPDFVEIIVLEDGNLAGACLYEGTPSNWDNRFIFPPVEVAAGDFLVVHFRPQGLPEEIDETVSKDESGGLLATPTAWDFWVRGATGLSSNNGVLSLCESPLGGFLDVVVYSNRTSASDERYRGFGSTKVMIRADEVAAAGAWVYSGQAIAPEDAVNPDGSTATRSISRSSDSRDTDSAEDWHITPTRGLTPGAVNTDEVYTP